FEQVVGNLLSNAFKYTPEGGRVHLALETDGEGARIEVRDNGPGIAPDKLPHVFDRFFRVDEARTTPGTGIGLSLARELTEQHGGRLDVESTVGFGTVFRVCLPAGTAHLEGRPDVVVHAAAPAPAPAYDPAPADPAPLPPPLSPARPPETPSTGEGGGEGGGDEDPTTVFVVNDNAEIRAFVARHLEAHYRVVEA